MCDHNVQINREKNFKYVNQNKSTRCNKSLEEIIKYIVKLIQLLQVRWWYDKESKAINTINCNRNKMQIIKYFMNDFLLKELDKIKRSKPSI